MTLEELVQHGQKIKKLIKKERFDEANSILGILNGYKMTLDLLEKSYIGHTVNSLRKAASNASPPNKDVATHARSLIKRWKDCVDTGSATKEDKKKDAPPPKEKTPPPKQNTVSLGGISIQPTNDPVRDNCRKLLRQSLGIDKDKYSENLVALMAGRVEEAIFKLHNRRTDVKYKNKVRSRYANLKDARNPDLRNSVMEGMITPEALAEMKPEDMASNELKKLREKFTKEAINDHQMAQNEGTKTDMFSCGKCKSKECTYTQLQTRSADEPMTTFVYCMACGNRWKFC